MERIADILKFPNKRTRTTYKKKLFSIYTTVDIIVVAVGVILAQILTHSYNVFIGWVF